MNLRTDLITCYVVRPTSAGHDFLQLRRRIDDYMGGTWQAISGQIEQDETAWQAALREMLEESGLVPVEFYRLAVVNTFYILEGDNLFLGVPFCAVVAADAAVQLNPEHDDFRWIAREQINDSFMWATDRGTLAELCRTILDDGPAKPYLRIALPKQS